MPMLTLILITVTMLPLDLEGMGHHLPRHLTKVRWNKLPFDCILNVRNLQQVSEAIYTSLYMNRP